MNVGRAEISVLKQTGKQSVLKNEIESVLVWEKQNAFIKSYTTFDRDERR